MLVLHDDAKREYAYGPAQGLPDTKVGTFTQALYDEAKKQGWVVISMKNDWKRIFAFGPRPAKQPVTGLPGGENRMSLIEHLLEKPRSLSRDAKYTVLNESRTWRSAPCS